MASRRNTPKTDKSRIHHFALSVSLHHGRCLGVVTMSDPRSMGRPPLRMADVEFAGGWGDAPGLTRLELATWVVSGVHADLVRQQLDDALAGGPGAPEGATGGAVQPELPLVWFDSD